jgi:putative membrane protein
MAEPHEPEEHEPDYRFTLANERTFLAWMRTSLALLAGGLAARELVGPFEVEGVHTGLAVVAVTLSLVLAVSSYRRWERVQRAMRRDEPLTRPLAVPLLALGIATVSGAAGLLVLFA